MTARVPQRSMIATGLVLEPLDTLFFRDGRPFGGAGQRGVSGLPLPQTLAGALTTHALRHAGFEFPATAVEPGIPPDEALRRAGAPEWALAIEARGPLPALIASTGEVEPLFPAPANLVAEKGGGEKAPLRRLDPLREPPPGWRTPDGSPGELRPIWLRDRGVRLEPIAGFLTRAGAEAWLRGGVPPRADVFDHDRLFAYEPRTGIAVAPDTLTAAEHMMYSVRLLRPAHRVEWSGRTWRVGFYAGVTWPDDGPGPAALFSSTGTLTWGGEGRRASVRPISPIVPPSAPPQEGRRSVAWLLTPAIFERGALPDRAAGLVASAVAPTIGLSGWDLARRAPKPTRFAVGAGSVYFFDSPGAPDAGALMNDTRSTAQGFGFTAYGGWNHV